MRLGQLARKLALRQTEIIEFLTANNVHIEDGSNTRLEDAHVALIMGRFAPERMEEMIKNDEEKPFAGTLPEEMTAPQELPAEQEVNHPLPTEAATDDIQPTDEKPELIKAPKVELSGLKVLGKIELPDIKKKEVEKTDLSMDHESLAAEEKQPREERKRYAQRNERGERRQTRNPISEQRDREAQEAEKKRRADTEREKEQKKKNYYKKVRASSPTKSARFMKESVEEISGDALEPEPKTWIGRLLRWFRT